MTNSKTTRRALFASAIALLLCVVMLIGTTFAWFTDTASTSVNTIKSGTLDVDLQIQDADGNWVTAVGKTLTWKKATGHETEDVIWEPGATYELESFKIKNNGNLALKYTIEITGIDGDAKLNEVIDWTYNDGATLTTTGNLAAGATSDAITIKGKMQETAGNEYQKLNIDGIAITVYATQDTVEYDSTTKDYDKDAEFATSVSTVDALTTAIAAGKSVKLDADLNVTTAVSIPANADVAIVLNGHKLSATNANTIEVAEGATLSVYGTGTVDALSHGKAAIVNNGGTVVLEGGTYTRSAEAGASATDSGSNSYYVLLNHGTMTIKNGVTVSANGKYSSLIDNGWYDGTKNTSGEVSTLTIEGGTFSGGLNTIKNDDYGVLIVNGGTLTNDAQFAVMNYNVATLNGGTFISTAYGAVYNHHLNDTYDKGALTINNGVFEYNTQYWGVYNDTTDGAGSVTIVGGVYSSSYICNNPSISGELQSDGTYKVPATTNP